MSNPVYSEYDLMARPIKILRLIPLLLLMAVPQAYADALDDILERGKLRVGLAEFAPWTMKSESNDLVGFEVDLARQLAEDMGVDVELRLYPWDAIIPAVRNGEIDIIAGGMAITPERALKVNFTIPVATSGIGIATNTEKTESIETLVDMNNPDIVISAVQETLGASVAQRLFPDADIRLMSSSEAALKLVIEGTAHALVTSMPEARFAALRNPDVIDLPIAEPLIASKEGLAVRKGEQELLNFLNAWVTAREADEWLSSTHDYWFGTLDWLHLVDGE